MSRRAIWVVGLALVAGSVAYFWVWQPGFEQAPVLPKRAGASEVDSPAASKADSPVLNAIQDVLSKLQGNAATPADLERLRQSLFADPQAGIAQILQFLAGGLDASTGQLLTVGAAGNLTSAPTLRVFLLDVLGQLTRTAGSRDADGVEREILAKKESPEEWVLALRNIAWTDSASAPYLVEKMEEMLAYEPWRATAPAGFLEAFDVAVYTGDPVFVPRFLELVQNGNGVARRAATIALDRLAESSPLAVMNYLNAHPQQAAERPLVRADYFAKADLSADAQRAAVERYLARTDTKLSEKTKFLAALASPGSFVSASVLSTEAKPDNALARFESIEKTTATWLKTNRFPELQSQITQLHEQVASELW